MVKKVCNNRGFTLIELLLAMAIFTTVMIITTTGFIAMNRSFTRGTVRKQLSESVQLMTEDITRVVRALPQKQGLAVSCTMGNTQNSPQWCPMPALWNEICLTGARYFWGKQESPEGLYKDTRSCNDTTFDTSDASVTKIVDTRYKVVGLKVQVTGADDAHLLRVSGAFRTADDVAFNNPDNVDTVKCRGSAQDSAVRTCAVERFSFTINARGDTQ